MQQARQTAPAAMRARASFQRQEEATLQLALPRRLIPIIDVIGAADALVGGFVAARCRQLAVAQALLCTPFLQPPTAPPASGAPLFAIYLPCPGRGAGAAVGPCGGCALRDEPRRAGSLLTPTHRSLRRRSACSPPLPQRRRRCQPPTRWRPSSAGSCSPVCPWKARAQARRPACCIRNACFPPHLPVSAQRTRPSSPRVRRPSWASASRRCCPQGRTCSRTLCTTPRCAPTRARSARS